MEQTTMRGSVLVCTAVLISASHADARAREPAEAEAEAKLSQAAIAYREGRYDQADVLLTEATERTEMPSCRAKIERQRALVAAATSRPEEALAALIRGLELDPGLRLDSSGVGPDVGSLFDCARLLRAEGRRVEGKLRPANGGRWACPVPATLEKAEAPERSTPTAVWIGAGVGVASGAVGATLGGLALDAANDGDPATSGKGLALAANVAFAVAGTAAIAALVIWLVD